MNQVEMISEAIRILTLEGQAILDCANRMAQGSSSEGFKKAISIFQASLQNGGKIIVTGVGKSGKIAQKISATLCSTGSLAVYVHPTEGLHGDLGVVRANDCVLALSYTGNTEEVVKLIPTFKNMGVPVVGLGGNPNSKLAHECNAWLDAEISAEACPHNLAPTTSTTLALALGDAVAITLMQLRGFGAKDFAQVHPGGSLGKKLHLRVEDLMHQGDAVPVLGPDTLMDQVVIISTQKQLGAVLVVDGPRLLGIITDGDIRRSLQHREKFFQLRARDVMTQKPVTVLPELMAQQALETMELRPSQISVLPVVDKNGNWKGILRLHDLVRAF